MADPPGSPRRGPSRGCRQLGAAIRELRARHGVSRVELASGAGLSEDDLEAIERGEVDVRFTTLVALAHAVPAAVADLVAIFDRRRSRG